MRHKRKSPIHYRIQERGGLVAGQPARRWHWRRNGGVFVLLVAVVSLVVHIVSGPVHGHSVKPDIAQTQSATTAASPVPAPSALQSTYFQLALPAGYEQQTNSQPVPGLLYAQDIIKPSAFGSLIIAIGIESMPTGGLSSDPSYVLRMQQPSTYSLTTKIVADDTVDISNDNQAGSVVAFWPHGQYLATIGVTSGVTDAGNSGDSDELSTLQVVLNAWRWQ